MKRSFLKIVSLFLIIGLNYSGIFAVGKTAAHFNDREASPNNLFNATKLDFSLGFFMPDGFRTQTQGGWGVEINGDNPGIFKWKDLNLGVVICADLWDGELLREKIKLNNMPEGRYTVFPVDLLPLGIGPAGIRDAGLENSKTLFRELGGNLGFKTEPVRGKRNIF